MKVTDNLKKSRWMSAAILDLGERMEGERSNTVKVHEDAEKTDRGQG